MGPAGLERWGPRRGDHHLDAVDAPDDEEEAVGEGPVPVLDLAHGGVVVLGAGRPEEEGGVHHEVLVHPDHVGQGVVHVVLVAPPRRAHAAHLSYGWGWGWG